MSSAVLPQLKIRAVTDAEKAFYWEHGWVKLPGLVDPADARALLDEADRMMGANTQVQHGAVTEKDPGRRPHQSLQTRSYDIKPGESDLFEALRSNRQIGNNAAALMSSPIMGPRRARQIGDSPGTILVKMPEGESGSDPTRWHQDGPYYPFDRFGALIFWFALDRVTPEMGSMCFVDGGPKIGSLGRFRHFPGGDTVDRYPGILENCKVTDPMDLQPGDATVHDMYTLHYAGPNLTDRRRMGFVSSYLPDDVIWTGQPHRIIDDLDLEINGPFDHPRFKYVSD